MKKNIVLLASLAFLGTSLTTAATIFLSNSNSIFASATDSQTVGHMITFSTNDNRIRVTDSNYRGFIMVKEKATKSGFDYELWGGIIGTGLISAERNDCLLYCETTDEDAVNPTNTLELLFGFKDIATFESVVIRGEIYTNKEKTEIVDSYVFTPGDSYCSYDSTNGDAEIKDIGFFKALITSIEINYTCPNF
ncbi:MAG: hypothetical protein J6T15_00085 [Bacilli bacterium]|nr:hypothetical protein [Bacilli bacterium]